jgi:hypothetical protein
MSRLARCVVWAALAALAGGVPSARAQATQRGGSQQVAPMSGRDTGSQPAGRIEGVVRDERGLPVAGAVVSALGASVATAGTDQQGRFLLSGLEPDAYLLRAHLPGVASSRRVVVQVHADERSEAALTVSRLTRALAGIGTGGLGTEILAAGMVGTEAEAASQPERDGEPAQAVAPRESGSDDHSELAWRIRHGRRSVLKDVTAGVDYVELDEPDSDAWSVLGRAVGSQARAATSLFTQVPWTGEVNLLTTTSFDGPRDLFTGSHGLPRGVAYMSIGAPAGQGRWAVQGAMTQGDVSSWIVAGSYRNTFRDTHAVGLGMSYSTQRYDGGNPAARAALTEAGRNVGAIYGSDTWTPSRRVSVDYGARYARYDYVVTGPLFSPHAGVSLNLTDDSRVRVRTAQHMLAPGAEEFVPPAVPGLWLPPERTFSQVQSGAAFRPERTRQTEIEIEHDLADQLTIGVRRVYERVDDQLVTLFGVRMPGGPPADLGHYFVTSAGSVDSEGWVVSVKCDVADRFRGTVEYSVANARWSPSPESEVLAVWAPSAVRSGTERVYDRRPVRRPGPPGAAVHELHQHRVGGARGRAEPLPGATRRRIGLR